MTRWQKSYPQTLRTGKGKWAVTYHLREDLFALKKPIPAGLPLPEGRALEGTEYVIYEGDPEELGVAGIAEPDRRPYAVYAMDPSGALAIATGRIFIRFKEGVSAADRAVEISKSGFTIDEVVDYAPNAAWLVPKVQGSKGPALKLHKLTELRDTQVIEPVLVIESMRR